MTDQNRTKFKTVYPVRHRTTAEEVAVQIRGMIHRAELQPGEQLPPERDLARMLGVSRPTLRAGISSLAAMGVVRSRPGAGTFVVEEEVSPSLDSGPLRMMASLQGFTSAEMFEARRALEMAIAGLAAERATGDQMVPIAEEITEMYTSLNQPEEFLIHDMRFHQFVAAASGNRILTALMNMVATILSDARKRTVNSAKDLKESAEMHRQIYRAIKDRDPVRACDAMRDHLVRAQKAQQLEAVVPGGVSND